MSKLAYLVQDSSTDLQIRYPKVEISKMSDRVVIVHHLSEMTNLDDCNVDHQKIEG